MRFNEERIEAWGEFFLSGEFLVFHKKGFQLAPTVPESPVCPFGGYEDGGVRFAG